MPLSIQKLEKFLSLKGFIPSKYFTIHSTCVFIEIISIENSDIFLLYIPSKYEFFVDKDKNVYKMQYYDEQNIDVDENIENTYKEIEFNGTPEVKDGNIAPYLEENYKKSINIKDVPADDTKEIKNIINQIKRLGFCVQNVKYKIAINYKNFLCSIKRDDTVECYSIANYSMKNYKKLYITVDLELLYEKIDSVLLNMKTIKEGIYNILGNNQFNHTKMINKLIEEKTNILELCNNTYINKNKYDHYIKESTEILGFISNAEKGILKNIYETNEKYKNKSLQGLNNDIDKSHHISKLNEELTSVRKIKEEIVNTIFELKIKKDNTVLTIDKIMFDNSVMLDSIFRNVTLLSELNL
jgi:hypothetical protein